MNIQLEVCVDNLESISHAINGGATRIELCSSLALGGLTPSYGMIKQAVQLSSVPLYVMIRPRQGDFLYQQDEIESMLVDIEIAKQLGVAGVVFGVLNADYSINMEACQQLMAAATGIGSTFHRAIDHCVNYSQALEDIALLGCERILTSGQAVDAYQGRHVIADMLLQADGRFSVMAGAGVTANNVKDIVATGINEVHLSGKSTRASKMNKKSPATVAVKMGADSVDDWVVPVTNPQLIHAVKRQLYPINLKVPDLG